MGGGDLVSKWSDLNFRLPQIAIESLGISMIYHLRGNDCNRPVTLWFLMFVFCLIFFRIWRSHGIHTRWKTKSACGRPNKRVRLNNEKWLSSRGRFKVNETERNWHELDRRQVFWIKRTRNSNGCTIGRTWIVKIIWRAGRLTRNGHDWNHRAEESRWTRMYPIFDKRISRSEGEFCNGSKEVS